MNIGSRTFRLVISFCTEGRACVQTFGLAVPQKGGTSVRYSVVEGNLTTFPGCPTPVAYRSSLLGTEASSVPKGTCIIWASSCVAQTGPTKKGEKGGNGQTPFMLEGTIPYPDNSRHFILIDIGNPSLDFRSVPSLFIAPDYNLRGSC